MESNRSSTEGRRSSVSSEGDEPSLDNTNVSETGSLSIIVLGASGDLAKKKTFPALFNLYQQGFLQSNEVHIFGYARTKISDDELRDRIRGHLLQGNNSSSGSGESEDAAKFLQLVKYISGAYDGEEGFGLLDTAIYEHEISKNTQDGSSRLYSEKILELKEEVDILTSMESFGISFRIRMQVLCLVAMEKPVSLTPEHICDEKVKILQSVVPIKDEEVVLGQYEGYKDDPTVPNDSNTPTFAMVVLGIHNERWEGVPFVLKAGKALNSRKAEIRVQFKEVPGDIFKCKKQGRYEFVIRLQPSEAMYMKLTVKQPGLEMSTTQSELDLSYQQWYQGVQIPEAYKRLILDTIRGDQQHFVRRDELKEAWEIFTPMLHRIDDGKLKPILYKQGSRGPVEADELLAKAGYMQTHGYKWVQPNL